MPKKRSRREPRFYRFERLERHGQRIRIKNGDRSTAVAAYAYASRHGFRVHVSKTPAGNMIVERAR